MRKMVALSQYCSVTDTRGWEKRISGSKAIRLEKYNAAVTDDQQIAP